MLLNERYAPSDQAVAWASFASLAASILSLYVPFGLRDLFFLVALVFVYRERSVFDVGPGLKCIAIMLVAYIVVFSIFSADSGRSAKGAYDMLRGVLMFFVGYLLAHKLADAKMALAFVVAVLGAILGGFAFPQYHEMEPFFGYHENPNNSAVTFVVYVLLVIPAFFSVNHKRQVASVGLIALVSGIYLLLLTNSRGAWLGLFGAGVMGLMFARRLKVGHRAALIVLASAGFSLALLFSNYKGSSLSLRDHIWMGLLDETWTESPWLGFGINTVKDIMMDMELPTLTAHNLFVEIFVSSGAVGLGYMLILMVALLFLLMSYRYRLTAQFYVGLTGLTAYFLMAQFDLKMSSFIFMASVSFFIGMLYSQRRPSSSIETQ